MGCCEHSNEQLGLQKEGNYLTSCRNISLLRITPLHAVSQLLTAQQAVCPHTTQYITVLWTVTIQSLAPTPHSVHCTFHWTLSVGTVKGCCTVHCVLCSVSSIRSSNSKQCCCVSELAKFDVLMKNTVWYVVTSQLCDTVMLVADFVQLFLNIHPPLHVHSL